MAIAMHICARGFKIVPNNLRTFIILSLTVFRSAGNSNVVKLQHIERHVLAWHGYVRDFQSRSCTHTSCQFGIHLLEAIGNGKWMRHWAYGVATSFNTCFCFGVFYVRWKCFSWMIRYIICCRGSRYHCKRQSLVWPAKSQRHVQRHSFCS